MSVKSNILLVNCNKNYSAVRIFHIFLRRSFPFFGGFFVFIFPPTVIISCIFTLCSRFLYSFVLRYSSYLLFCYLYVQLRDASWTMQLTYKTTFTHYVKLCYHHLMYSLSRCVASFFLNTKCFGVPDEWEDWTIK